MVRVRHPQPTQIPQSFHRSSIGYLSSSLLKMAIARRGVLVRVQIVKDFRVALMVVEVE